MARPSLLTPETVKRITDAIKLGATYKMAAQYGGVTYETLNSWLKRGEAANKLYENDTTIPDPEAPFIQLFQLIQKAEGDAVLGWLAKIEKEANEGNWQAAAWKLERRYPRDYSRNVQEIVGEGDGPVKVNFYLPSNGRELLGAAKAQAARDAEDNSNG